MSDLGHAQAFAQRWTDDESIAHQVALPPAVGTIEFISATGFPAAVNRRLAAVAPSGVVILSDGMARISQEGVARLVGAAERFNGVVLATSPNVDASILAVPGDWLIAHGGLCEHLQTYYWAEELCLRDPDFARMETVMAYIEPGQRERELDARYYEAVADLGVLDSHR